MIPKPGQPEGETNLLQGGGADVPLFETIKTNAGTRLKNELQQ